MIKPMKPIDIIKHEYLQQEHEIVEKYETVDGMYGLGVIELTDKDIDALKTGKYIYSQDGEYATLLCYSE